MKKVSLLLVGLLCISLSSFAGEVITNDTGEDATGLRVVFSAPVEITAFGDTLMEVDQTGLADEFVFSGGMVSPWGSHWLSWTPSSARIVSHEWLTGSTTVLQGLPAEQLADRPVVTGNLLNPDYFAHPAYVMQGVSEKDAIFAMPLDGIQELEFYPVVDGVDLDDVTWSVEISHPEGIGANIEGKTLYIWGSNALWAGYGEVTLEAVVGDAVSSVVIPVTVFRENKTLINSEGKKDYFVPWSPEIDINRVLSTQAFLAKYGYHDEKLDRSLSWASWELATRMRSVTLDNMWINDSLVPGWTDEAIRLRIDVLLDELLYDNVDWLFIRVMYFMETAQSEEIIPLYDYGGVNAGYPMATMPNDILLYFVNQAHNKGIQVAFGPFVQDLQFCRGAIAPTDWSQWFESYSAVCNQFAELAREVGVDLFVVGESLQNVSGTISYLEWGEYFKDVIESCRARYPGPLTYLDGLLGNSRFGQDPDDWGRYTFFNQLDYIGTSPYFWGMISSLEPTVEEIVAVYPELIQTFILPLLRMADRPVLFFENGIPSMDEILFRFEQFVAGAYLGPANPNEQATWYEALFQACEDEDWLHGYGWYGVSVAGIGGLHDTSLTFQGKPAEDILRFYYGDEDESRRMVSIDGSSSDWANLPHSHTDPLGDASAEGPDLIELKTTADDMYLYALAVFYGEITTSTTLTLVIDLDIDGQPDVPVGVFYANGWIGTVAGFGMDYRAMRGVINVSLIKEASAIEFSIPLRYLEWPTDLRMQLSITNNVRGGLIDQSGWISLTVP